MTYQLPRCYRLWLALALVCWSPAALSLSSDAYVDEAEGYLQRGQSAAAAIQLKNALVENPDNAAARLWLGRAYLQLGDTLSALKELERAEALGIPRRQLILELGRAYLGAGQYPRLLEKVDPVADDPTDLQAQLLLLRAQAYTALKNHTAADQLFLDALKLQPESAAGYLGRAQLAYENQNRSPGSIAELLDRALQLEPTNADAWTLKGFLLRQNQDQGAAVEAFEQALKLSPQNVKAHLGRGIALLSLNQTERAGDDIAWVLQRYPQHVMARYLQALRWLTLGENQRAFDALQQIRHYAQLVPQINLLAGSAALRMGLLNQAEHFLQLFLAQHPGHPQASHLLATVLAYLHNQAEQLAVLERSAPSDDPGYYAMLGDIYLAKGDLRHSREQFETAVQLNPDLPLVRSQLGLIQIKQGALEDGIEQLKAALALSDTQPRTEVLLANALLQQGDLAGAKAAIDRLQGRFPDQSLVHHLRSALHMAAGDTEQAKGELTRLLALRPDFIPGLINRALLAMHEGDRPAAQAAFERIVRLQPGQATALYGLAVLAEQQGDLPLAQQRLEQLRQSQPASQPFAEALAAFYLRHGEHAKVVEVLDFLHFNPPLNEQFLRLRAQAELALGDLAGAASSLNRLARVTAAVAPVRYAQGVIYLAMERPAVAIATLREALMLRPDYPEALLAWGRAAFADGQADEAQRIANRLGREYPQTGYAEDLQGHMALQRDDFSRAAAWYQAAYQRSGRPDLMRRIFQAKLRAGGGRAVLVEMEAWMGSHPDDTGVRQLLAHSRLNRSLALQRAGLTDAAIASYRAVLAIAPANLAALGQLTLLHHALGQPEAVDYAQRAHQLVPERAEIAATYGWMLYLYGSKEEGLAVLQQAVASDPSSAGIRLQWATALDREGLHRQALDALDPIFATRDGTPLFESAQQLKIKLDRTP